jgi:hypothetical protein
MINSVVNNFPQMIGSNKSFNISNGYLKEMTQSDDANDSARSESLYSKPLSQ